MKYKDIIKKQKNFFLSDATKDYSFRIKQLKSLKNNIIKYEKEILESLSF